VVADQVFDRAMTPRLGTRRVELVDRGRANSPHDVTMYLPEERVLFAGDVLVQSPLPYTGMSWPVLWIEVFKELEKVPVAALVPGHGPVMRDHRYAPGREVPQAVTSRVGAMARQGKPVEQIQDSLKGGRHDKVSSIADGHRDCCRLFDNARRCANDPLRF
jgi:glyoxylase-like metal-dependent hydrolase (beta-lactamase superfamily II)